MTSWTRDADLPVLAGSGVDGAPDDDTAQWAALAWRAGGLVAMPTETVYGLAADAQDPEAVARIYRAKGRPADHPLIVHVADRSALAAWSDAPNAAAEVLAAAFWPGPLTVVVRRGARAGDHITGGQDTVALRSPGHPVALACLRALGELTGDPARGVAAPSANRFGRISPTSSGAVVAELGGRLDPRRDLVIDGGSCDVGVESTIVDCTVDPPRVLRPGAVSQAEIDAVLAGVASAALAPANPGASRSAEPAARAPGMLDSHYAPLAHVRLVEAGEALPPCGEDCGLIAAALITTPAGCVRLAAPESSEEYARDLYAALRQADVLALHVIVAVLPDGSDGPLALAVRDRLTRAAHPG